MNRIKQLREENNWTQLELSQKINCAMSSIAMYEKEDRKPSLEVLIKLSDIFDCSIDYLLGKSDIRNPEITDIDTDKIKIGLSSKDYTHITDNQRKQIEDFARFVLKDNEKKKNEDK